MPPNTRFGRAEDDHFDPTSMPPDGPPLEDEFPGPFRPKPMPPGANPAGKPGPVATPGPQPAEDDYQSRMSVIRPDEEPTELDGVLMQREAAAGSALLGEAAGIMRVTPGGRGALAKNETAALFGKEMVARAIATRPTLDAALDLLPKVILPEIASEMVYSWSQGGKDIEGGTIVMAQLLADVWNVSVQTSISSVSPQPNGTMQVFMEARAVDLVKGRFFSVAGCFTTSSPPGKFANKPDNVTRWINMQILAQGSKLARKAVMGVIPYPLWWMCFEISKRLIEEEEKVQGGFPAQIAKVIKAFEELGITLSDLEGGLKTHRIEWHRGHLQQLRTVYKALRSNDTTPEALRLDGERWRAGLAADSEAALGRVKANPGLQALGVDEVRAPVLPPELAKQLEPEAEGNHGGD